MKPTLEQYEKSSAQWRGSHKGVSYLLSHHGISDYQREGTWCYYIFVNSDMFINSDDFLKFDLEPKIIDLYGSFMESFDYYDIPDYGFHGGITWYSKEYFINKEGKKQTSIKIGCDYGHLWDSESGYWQGLENVRRDCENMIDKFVENHPVKTRCIYSGKLDIPEQFYKAENGALVHKSNLENLQKDGDSRWLPEINVA